MELYTLGKMRQLLVLENKEMASYFAAIRLCSIAKESIEKRQKANIALSGGSTPNLMYDVLTTSPLSSQVNWEKVNFFWSDERYVPLDHPESNFGQAAAYFRKNPLSHAQTFPVRTDFDPDRSAQEYETRIHDQCDQGCFDLILLGLGEDGHIASLFPDTKALTISDRLVSSNFVPQKSSYRITFTFSCLQKAAHIILLAFGKSKQQIMKQILSHQSEEEYPVQRLEHLGTPVLYIIDQEAAALTRFK